MTNAIIYTRVSSEDQVKGLSLESQEKTCIDYAKQNGFTVTEVFREAGESAKTTDRTQLIKLLDHCKKHKGKIEYLIVYKVDRFARRAEDHHTLRAYLTRLGIRLCSATEPIEDTSTGRLMESMLASFAQFDNEIRTERAVNGLKGRVAEGGWVTRPPLGFITMRDARHRPTLAPDPVRAPIVKKVFEAYATGNYTLETIAQFSHDQGLRTLRNRKIYIETIRLMLMKPVYIGYRKDKDTGELLKCLHDGIVDERTYYRVQEVMSGKKKEFRPQRDQMFPLRKGFVRCADCDHPVNASSPKGRSKYYPKYHCSHCRVSIIGKPTSVDRDVAHEQFKELLKNIQPKPRHLALFKLVLIEQWEEEHNVMSNEKRETEKRLQELDMRRERVLELFIDGSLNKEEKEAQFLKIDEERTLLRMRHSDLEHEVDDRQAVIEAGVELMTDMSSFWEKAPLSAQLRFQRFVFPEGIKYDFKTGFGTAKLGLGLELINKNNGIFVNGRANKKALEPFWPDLKIYLIRTYEEYKQIEVLCRTKIRPQNASTSVYG